MLNPVYVSSSKKNFLQPGWILFAFVCLLASCATPNKTIYFTDLPTDTTLTNVVMRDTALSIRKGDLLSITVSSLSPDNTVIYNAPQDAVGAQAGYLVDEQGNIEFVKLGKVKAAGLNRSQLKASLQQKLAVYLAEPIVAVGVLNRHVTMMGGIKPQVLPFNGEQMTLLEALAASGDIGATGRTDNILVIRETPTGKTFKRLDLTDRSIFYSPYFYLQPNDVVYVEPVKEKANKTAQIISYVTTGITFLIFIIDRLIK